MKVKIGNNEYDVKVASSEAKRKKGLKGIKELPKGSGLVLSFSEEQVVPITMRGMKIPLDIIFSKGGKVQEVRSASIDSADIMIEGPSDLILEINRGEATGIKPGDEISWVGEKSEDGTIVMASGGVAAKEGQMHVLDEDGKNQMNIKGNERIFSRKHTERLIKLATKADSTKDDVDYKKLGKAMVEMIIKQDTQEQEYVKT
jgi:uncharacterized membrane protein (UPF0127 family)